MTPHTTITRTDLLVWRTLLDELVGRDETDEPVDFDPQNSLVDRMTDRIDILVIRTIQGPIRLLDPHYEENLAYSRSHRDPMDPVPGRGHVVRNGNGDIVDFIHLDD